MTGHTPDSSHPSLPVETSDEKPSATRRIKGLFSRFGGRIKRAFKRRVRRRWIMVIVNPASGQGSPDLRMFNRMIRDAGYEWEIEVTNEWGDGARLAKKAAAEGASLVAAYGGDGTVMDVASGLLGGDTPLAILPGGTGNALAKELCIPFNLAEACALMVSEPLNIRKIDLGRANDSLFVLRFGAGLEAEITRTADRSLKDRMGLLAYVSATVQAWNQAMVSTYRLEMDGRVVEIDGLACMVANAGNLGIPGVAIAPEVSIEDGLLDVFVIRRADLAELASLAGSIIGADDPGINRLPHWQCRELHLHADPAQYVEADGEELGQTPATIRIEPGALKVIVPAPERLY